MAKQMKLILQRQVDNLGDPGDVVTVKPGYGRNYLIPKGMAVPATDANIRMVMAQKARLEEEAAAEREALAEIAGEFEGVTLNIARKVAEGDRLYGSVTAADISEALKLQGHAVTQDQVLLEKPIKELGINEVAVSLGHGVETEVKVWVVKEEED